jgi:ADP-L-glycero-D-manno-heptose 6-epimerase
MIVITGGAGFIGSALAWELNRRGREDLLLVDELGSDEKWRNLAGLRFLDYLDKDAFERGIAEGKFDSAGVEAVLHMGACSSTTERDVDYLMRNNFEYTKTLADFCVPRGVRLIYASSAATYGDGSAGYGDTHSGLDELRPLNPYGWSKHAFDLWALRRGWLDRVVGLKYFNVFGPNEYHKGDMRSMVHKAWEQIRDTGSVRLFKSDRPEYRDGEQRRDFVYVKDAVAATLFFLEKPEANGIFNIGSGRAESWNDLVAPVFEAMRLEPRIEYVEMPHALKGKYQYHTQADLGKLRAAAYTKECRPLREAVLDYVTNYLMPGKWLEAADSSREKA